MFKAKPIETFYNGYRFRSRSEARWAVFFDTLEIEYEYEPEGFELSPLPKSIDIDFKKGRLAHKKRIRYLPDFWLPKLQCWIEVKPHEPTTEEEYKAALLSYATDCDVFIFFGQIPWADDLGISYESAYVIQRGASSFDWCQHWCECPDCGSIGIRFEARSDRLPCKTDRLGEKSGCPRHGENLDKGYNGCSSRLMTAYVAARGARFEFKDRQY